MNYLIESKNKTEALKKISLLQNGEIDLLFKNEQIVGIDHIRNLNKTLALQQKTIKNLVVTEAERLTIPAQNAFLKLLEEPPAKINFTLTTKERRNLLPTIVSRCCLVRLNNQLEITAIDTNIKKASLFIQAIKSIEKAVIYRSVIKKELKEDGNALEYLNIWQSVLRDSLLIKIGVVDLTFQKLQKQIIETLEQASVAELVKIIKIGNTYYQYLQSNTVGSDRIAGVYLNQVALICTNKKI